MYLLLYCMLKLRCKVWYARFLNWIFFMFSFHVRCLMLFIGIPSSSVILLLLHSFLRFCFVFLWMRCELRKFWVAQLFHFNEWESFLIKILFTSLSPYFLISFIKAKCVNIKWWWIIREFSAFNSFLLFHFSFVSLLLFILFLQNYCAQCVQWVITIFDYLLNIWSICIQAIKPTRSNSKSNNIKINSNNNFHQLNPVIFQNLFYKFFFSI